MSKVEKLVAAESGTLGGRPLVHSKVERDADVGGN